MKSIKDEKCRHKKCEFVYQKQRVVWLRHIDLKKVKDPLKLQYFVEWSAMPRKTKCPKTQGAFSKKIGVSQDTLSDWKRLEGFWEDVAVYRKKFFEKHLSEIYYGLINKMKMWYQRDAEIYGQFLREFGDEFDYVLRHLESLDEEERWRISKGLNAMRRKLKHNRIKR